MATQVSQLQLLGALGASVAIVLSVSGSCDKAIEQRADGLNKRIERIERYLDSQLPKPARGPQP